MMPSTITRPASSAAPVAADPTRHFARVDVLRAVAILLVFLFHYWYQVGSRTGVSAAVAAPVLSGDLFSRILRVVPENGYVGVRLFFVISGFCIHLSFLKWVEKPSAGGLRSYWPGFLWRRFWRIYPPYLLVLLPVWYFQYHAQLDPRAWRHLGAHLLMVHNFFWPTLFSIVVSFWSIAVEWQLYLVYPLFLLAARRWGPWPAVAGASLLAVGLNAAAGSLPFAVLHSPFGYWFEWTLGALIAADAVREDGGALRGLGRWALPLWLAVAVAWVLLLPFVICYVLATLACGALLVAALHRRTPLAWWERALVPVGLCSYSLYLVHEPLLELLFNGYGAALRTAPAWVVWGVLQAAFFAAVLAVSRLFYHLVEVPSTRVGQQPPHFLSAR